MSRIWPALLTGMALSACGQNMTDQPKYNEYKPGPLFRRMHALFQTHKPR